MYEHGKGLGADGSIETSKCNLQMGIVKRFITHICAQRSNIKLSRVKIAVHGNLLLDLPAVNRRAPDSKLIAFVEQLIADSARETLNVVN